MYAYNCEAHDLWEATSLAGLRIDWRERKCKGIGFGVKLLQGSTSKSCYSKWNIGLDGDFSRRSSVNVCIHGHYAFFKYLFKINPRAEVVSTWYGHIRITKDNLEEWYEELQAMKISDYLLHYYGLTQDDQCDCNGTFRHNRELIEEMGLDEARGDLNEAFSMGAPNDVIAEGVAFEMAHFNPDLPPIAAVEPSDTHRGGTMQQHD